MEYFLNNYTGSSLEDVVSDYSSEVREDPEFINFNDLGAGPNDSEKVDQVIVGKKAKKMSFKPAQQEFLLALTEQRQEEKKSGLNILELGTGFGLATVCFIATKYANSIRTIDGCKNMIKYSYDHLPHLDAPSSIAFHNATFDSAIQEIPSSKLFDIILIDGDNIPENFERYFHRLQAMLAPRGIIIMKNLHWVKKGLEDQRTLWNSWCDLKKQYPRLTFYDLKEYPNTSMAIGIVQTVGLSYRKRNFCAFGFARLFIKNLYYNSNIYKIIIMTPNKISLLPDFSDTLLEKEQKFKEKYDKSPHREVQQLVELVGDNDKIQALDIGCGLGRNSVFMADNGYSVESIDRNIGALGDISNLAKQNALDITTKIVDLNNYSVNQDYNIIISTVVLQFLEKTSGLHIVSSMQDHTLLGGYNLIIVPIDSDDHKCPIRFPGLFTEGELRDLYQNWDILEYNEDFGTFHRKDEFGNKIAARFATIIARKK